MEHKENYYANNLANVVMSTLADDIQQDNHDDIGVNALTCTRTFTEQLFNVESFRWVEGSMIACSVSPSYVLSVGFTTVVDKNILNCFLLENKAKIISAYLSSETVLKVNSQYDDIACVTMMSTVHYKCVAMKVEYLGDKPKQENVVMSNLNKPVSTDVIKTLDKALNSDNFYYSNSNSYISKMDNIVVLIIFENKIDWATLQLLLDKHKQDIIDAYVDGNCGIGVNEGCRGISAVNIHNTTTGSAVTIDVNSVKEPPQLSNSNGDSTDGLNGAELIKSLDFKNFKKLYYNVMRCEFGNYAIDVEFYIEVDLNALDTLLKQYGQALLSAIVNNETTVEVGNACESIRLIKVFTINPQALRRLISVVVKHEEDVAAKSLTDIASLVNTKNWCVIIEKQSNNTNPIILRWVEENKSCLVTTEEHLILIKLKSPIALNDIATFIGEFKETIVNHYRVIGNLMVPPEYENIESITVQSKDNTDEYVMASFVNPTVEKEEMSNLTNPTPNIDTNTVIEALKTTPQASDDKLARGKVGIGTIEHLNNIINLCDVNADCKFFVRRVSDTTRLMQMKNSLGALNIEFTAGNYIKVHELLAILPLLAPTMALRTMGVDGNYVEKLMNELDIHHISKVVYVTKDNVYEFIVETDDCPF